MSKVIARWGLQSWNSEDGSVFTPEDEVSPDRLASVYEGVLQVCAGADRMVLHDELWALLLHLGMRAPVAVLRDGYAAHRWGFTASAAKGEIRADGDRVILTVGEASVAGPAAQMWPVLVGVAARFVKALRVARGADDGHVRSLEGDLHAAMDVVAERGWSLPEVPGPERVDPTPSSPVARSWVRVDLYARHPDSPAFYRSLLGERFAMVVVREANPEVGAPQWMGSLRVGDEEVAASIGQDGAFVCLAGEGRSAWMDPWGAVWWTEPGANGGLQAVAHELLTRDPAQASAEYAVFFGCEVVGDGEGWRLLDGSGGTFATVRAAPVGESSQWVHYLPVDDVDAAIAEAEAAGARVVERGEGRCRMVDRFGGTFALARA